MSDLDPIWTKLQVIGGAGPFGHVLIVVRTPHKAPDAVVWCLKVADIVREAGSTKKKKNLPPVKSFRREFRSVSAENPANRSMAGIETVLKMLTHALVAAFWPLISLNSLTKGPGLVFCLETFFVFNVSAKVSLVCGISF